MRKIAFFNFGILKSSPKLKPTGILKNGEPSTVEKKKITFAETAIFYGPDSSVEYKPTKTDTRMSMSDVDFGEAGPSNFERNATFRCKKNLKVNRMGTVKISLNKKIYKAEKTKNRNSHKVVKMSSSVTIVSQMEEVNLSNALEKDKVSNSNCWYGVRKRLRRFCNKNATLN